MTPDLSIVIPCFNEIDRVDRLGPAIRELLAAAPALTAEAVLVDDGSIDGTADALRSVAAELEDECSGRLRVEVVTLEKNAGKGGALQAGVARSHGAWVLTADADMATRLTEVLAWQRDGAVELGAAPPERAPILIASREHRYSVVQDSAQRRLMGRVFNFCVQAIAGLYVSDSQCGFKLYPGAVGRSLFAELRDQGWGHDVELLRLAQLNANELVSMPIEWRAVAVSKVRPVRDAVAMLGSLLRLRVSLFWRYTLGFVDRASCLRPGRLDIAYSRWSFVLLVTSLLLVVATFRQYGITWDEDLHRRYGRLVYDYYSSLLGPDHDRSAIHFSNLYLYGGLFDVIGYLAGRWSWIGEFETRHLVNALVGWIGLVGAWKLAGHWGVRTGAWALTLLLLTPTYYGHMFANPKDIPFAAAYVWSIYYLIRWFEHLPRVPRALQAKLAASIGAALAIRAGGLLLLCYLLLVIGVYLAGRAVQQRSVRALGQWPVFESVAIVVVGAWTLMVMFWPFAYEEPIRGPLTALASFSQFPKHIEMLYGGTLVPNDPGPLDYVPRLLAIQLPELMLVLLPMQFLGLLVAVRRIRSWSLLQEQLPELFLLFATLFPLAHVIVTRAVLYDSLRHLTFVLPLLAVLAARGVDRLSTLARTSTPLRMTGLTVAAVWAIWQLSVMVRLHPYQYVYYNVLVGGPAAAETLYEADYWAASYREATFELTRKLDRERETLGDSAPARYRVFAEGPGFTAAEFYPEYIERAGSGRTADFVITITRWHLQELYEHAPLALTVERMGVPLAHVYDMRPLREQDGAAQ